MNNYVKSIKTGNIQRLSIETKLKRLRECAQTTHIYKIRLREIFLVK